ncbi:MAG: GTP 3',8-cyclase MoaA [Bacilli bacterium]
MITDAFDRPLRDLRVSVTDRCNFRCTYCMPRAVFGADHPFLPREALLTFEEITRLASLFAALGVRKIRLTGGEPLLRTNLERLIESLSEIPGIEDIALTTNGSLLSAQMAHRLKKAGLRRVTVSLDSLNDQVFQAMNDVSFPVRKVLDAIEAAASAGLAPVKINMVVKRGVNEDSIIPMARHFRGTGHIVRFIEFMDVGTANGWRLAEVVSAAEMAAAISREWPLSPIPPERPGEVAARYRYADNQGEIGVISAVTHAFCGSCNRARLSSEGKLFTCLFGSEGFDLRRRLRDGASDGELLHVLSGIWSKRRDRYSELRSQAGKDSKKVEMFHIGG